MKEGMIYQLFAKACRESGCAIKPSNDMQVIYRFTELVVEKVLDEVADRAYCSGDRAWSNELDRSWVELEFGMGKLAELKNESAI